MDRTFIGRGIRFVGGWIERTSDNFFNNTWLGQKLSSAKKWFDNTAVGRFVTKLSPIISICGYALGDIGGGIGSVIQTGVKIVNIIKNPT